MKNKKRLKKDTDTFWDKWLYPFKKIDEYEK